MGGPRNVDAPNNCLLETSQSYLVPTLRWSIFIAFSPDPATILAQLGEKYSGYSHACCDVPARAFYQEACSVLKLSLDFISRPMHAQSPILESQRA